MPNRSTTKFSLYHLCCSFLHLIITLATTIFILWLIYHPKTIKVYVESASLTAFTLTNNTTLTYNLTLHISIRNPNNRVSFYYDSIEARALYNDANFGIDSNLSPFFQRRKNTTMLRSSFMGQASGMGSINNTFDAEMSEGFFYVEVKIYAKIRLKIEFVRVGHLKPEVHCVVKLPVPARNSTGASFERTRCDVDKF